MSRRDKIRSEQNSDSIFASVEGRISPLLALIIWGVVVYLMINVGESIGTLSDLFLR